MTDVALPDDALHAVLAVLADGAAVLDGEGRFLFANAALSKLVGCEASALVDARRSFRDVVGGGEHEPRAGRSTEASLRHANGHLVEVEISFTALADRARTVLVVRDITPRRQAEQAMLRVHDALELGLNEALQLREDFLVIATHELRTPLTPLLLHIQSARRLAAELAAEDDDDDDAARTKRRERLTNALTMAEKTARRIDKLVTQLLDVSRTTRDGMTLSPERVDLREVVGNVVATWSAEAQRARCDVVIDARAPVVGRWDTTRLEMIVANLVSNAIKYGAGRRIDVRVTAADARARLVVADHGIGIAREHRDHLFKRFARGVSTRNYGGFGVGLWIVREAVEAHGGAVSFADTPGGGATFVVELPLEA